MEWPCAICKMERKQRDIQRQKYIIEPSTIHSDGRSVLCMAGHVAVATANLLLKSNFVIFDYITFGELNIIIIFCVWRIVDNGVRQWQRTNSYRFFFLLASNMNCNCFSTCVYLCAMRICSWSDKIYNVIIGWEKCCQWKCYRWSDDSRKRLRQNGNKNDSVVIIIIIVVVLFLLAE